MAVAVQEAPLSQRGMFERLCSFVFPGDDVAMYSGCERIVPYEPFDWLPPDEQWVLRRLWLLETPPIRHHEDVVGSLKQGIWVPEAVPGEQHLHYGARFRV